MTLSHGLQTFLVVLVCMTPFVKESLPLPTGQAERKWEISELSPLDPVDIKTAYETLLVRHNIKTKSQNAVRDDTGTIIFPKDILGKGDQLEKDKSYYSPSKAFRLILQSDNNFMLYRECDGQAVFATDNVQSSTTAVMQDDGHFVVALVWSTETWGYGNSHLFLSDFGYFFLCNWTVGCYWRSDTHLTKDCNKSSGYVPHSKYEYKVIVHAGDLGQNVPLETRLYSNNSKFYFAQDGATIGVWRDCDHRQGFKAAWPRNSTFDRMTLQSDGNLAILAERWNPVWNSHTSMEWPSHAGAELRLYDNGFLYLCDSNGCYWQSSGFLDKCNPFAPSRSFFSD